MTGTEQSAKRRSLFYLHISVFLWGFTGIFGKVITLNATMIVWYRLLITVVMLFILSKVFKRHERITLKQFYQLAYVGFWVCFHWLLFYAAIKYSNASVGISCISTVAVFTTFLEPLMTGKRFNLLNLLLALSAAAGMYMIYNVQEFYRTGILLGLFAALLSSYFTILNTRLIRIHNSETVTFYELLSAFIILSISFPAYSFFVQESVFQIPDFRDIILLIIFSLFCTVIPFNLATKSLKHISAFTANLSVNLEPVYGIIAAILILNEQKELTLPFYAGSTLILLSVVIYGIINGRQFMKTRTNKD
ncbi:MAG: DMT family transporter [Bacteroidota bacterium]